MAFGGLRIEDMFHCTVPSAPPQMLECVGISDTKMTVSWREVPPIHQNGIITLYEVSYTALEDHLDPAPNHQNATDLSTNLTNLHESANYSVQVRAYTQVGAGPYSNQAFLTTDAAGTFNH